MKSLQRYLPLAEALAFLAGGMVFYIVLRTTGVEALRLAWNALGLQLAAVFCLYPLMACWDTASWKNLFQTHPGPSFGGLFWIRLAGEAVNNVTPGVDIGGEPFKIKWLAERFKIPLPDATSSVILAKTSILAGEGVFVWVGVLMAWDTLPWSPSARLGFLTAAGVTGAVIGGLFLFQRTSLFGGWSPGTRNFYSRFMPRFALSVALNTVGWIAGAVELWFFAYLLGFQLDWKQALILESLVQLVRTASFFIPGNVGTQEAGYAYLIHLMGFHPSAGLALSLLKRGRQLFWTAAGFGVWAVFQMKQRPASFGATQPLLDTPVDRWIHRPPARWFAQWADRWGWRPNTVTLLSLLPALAAARLLALGRLDAMAAGIFFFYVWAVLDHADGELARRQHSQSALGQVLDDSFDLMASTVILWGLWVGLLPYWNPADQATLSRLFYPALFLNASTGLMGLAVRRGQAVRGQRKPRWFDRLMSREPFYLVLLLAVVALWTRQPQVYAFLGGLLILGQGVLFVLSLGAFLKRG